MNTAIVKSYVNTNAGQIHLRSSPGQDGAAPVVLLHQTASSGAMYESIMRLLQGEAWLLAPDTPGFGSSYHPSLPHTIAGYAQALFDALDQIGVARCSLFGHHTGAAIAVQLATDQPHFVQRLILSGPPLLNAAQIRALRRGLQPIQVDSNGRFLADTWQRLQKKSAQAPLDLLLRELSLTLQAGASYPQAYTAVFDQPFAQQLAALTCPTLLMAGEHDSLGACLEPAFTILQNGALLRLNGADTFVCDTQPDVVAAVIRTFLLDGNMPENAIESWTDSERRLK